MNLFVRRLEGTETARYAAAPRATRKQAINLQAAIPAALRKRDRAVVGEGSPVKWRLVAN
jgi:hypothetical protein